MNKIIVVLSANNSYSISKTKNHQKHVGRQIYYLKLIIFYHRVKASLYNVQSIEYLSHETIPHLQFDQ